MLSALARLAAYLTRPGAAAQPLAPEEARPLRPLLRWLARRQEAPLDDVLDAFGTRTWLTAVRLGVVEEVEHHDLEVWGCFGRITPRGRRTLAARGRPQTVT